MAWLGVRDPHRRQVKAYPITAQSGQDLTVSDWQKDPHRPETYPVKAKQPYLAIELSP